MAFFGFGSAWKTLIDLHLCLSCIHGGRSWGGKKMYNMKEGGFLEIRLWFIALSNHVIMITANVVFVATCTGGQWVVIVILRRPTRSSIAAYDHTTTFSKPDLLLFQSHNTHRFSNAQFEWLFLQSTRVYGIWRPICRHFSISKNW